MAFRALQSFLAATPASIILLDTDLPPPERLLRPAAHPPLFCFSFDDLRNLFIDLAVSIALLFYFRSFYLFRTVVQYDICQFGPIGCSHQWPKYVEGICPLNPGEIDKHW